MRVRVCSYNVLSSKLARSDAFPHCPPALLNPARRLDKVLGKLSPEVERRAVICLQEITLEWIGPLHVFFTNHNYQFVTGTYGQPFNGYMGVGLAWPTTEFEALEVKITRASESRDGRWLRRPDPSMPQKVLNVCWDMLSPILQRNLVHYNIVNRKPEEHEYEESQKIWNYSVAARLKHRHANQDTDDEGVSKTFCVATYHMPCRFGQEKLMTMHTALVSKFVQKFSKGDPYVLAGDFNIKPSSSLYAFLTSGSMPTSDPAFPRVREGDNWTPQLQEGMRSAYQLASGSEPDFTNYAPSRSGGEDFCDVLDYIFLSPHWNVEGVLQLPHRDEVKGPLPTEEEPSDHLLVAADLKL